MISLFSVHSLSQTQLLSIKLINRFSIDADSFVGTDNLGYYYYIKNNVFFKKKNNEIMQYQNVSLGELTKVDLINPLKIVLFYENFNKVILLDNQLNEITTIDFSLSDDPMVIHNVGMSGQNSLWVFNVLNQQIGLYNYEVRKNVRLNQPIKSTFLSYQTDFNSMVWIDERYIISKIDVFGKIEVLDTLAEFDNFQFITRLGVVLTKNGKLFYKKIAEAPYIEIEINVKSIKNFAYKVKILTIFTGEEIINYNLNLP